jgi:hypothetical protein
LAVKLKGDAMESRTRSPRYPQVGLREAIERIKLVYEKEHRHPTDKEVVAKDLNYTGLNGASLGMIASLKQYDLLENAGDGLRVTDNAVAIIELPPGEPERVEAIRRAAFAPKLFSELTEVYGDRLPSDENLRLYLVKRGFNRKAAGVVIRAYRDTISLVKEEGQDYNGNPSAVIQYQEADKLMPVPTNIYRPDIRQPATGPAFIDVSPSDRSGFTEALLYRVSDDCRVRVMFDGPVTQEAINKLIAYLKLGIEDFPKRSAATDQARQAKEGELEE